MRKILFTLIFFLFAIGLYAQAPTQFKYQGVARDADLMPYSNTELGIKVSIVKDNGNGSGSGIVEYSERHLIQTSAIGVFSLNIGAGQTISGNINEISWGANTYWLKVEMDIHGGEDYTFMGSSPILPVPIAMHAMTVEDKNDADADPQNELQTLSFDANNQMLSLTDGGQVDLGDLAGNGGGSDDQTLQLDGTNLTIENGNQVDLAVIQDGTEDADADPQNELQTIAFDANTNELSISNGNTINIPAGQADADADPQNELQELNFDLNTLDLTISEGNTVHIPLDVDDNDHSPFNEFQTIELDGNNLILSDGGGQVDLSNLAGNGGGSDDQTLQLDGTNLTIENGNQVDLAVIQDGINDADADPANELQTLNYVEDSGKLILSDGNTVNLPIDDIDPSNEIQELAFDVNTLELSISEGNSVHIPLDVDDNDHSPFNEFQTIELDGNNLILSDGGGQVNLAGISGSSLWEQANNSNLFTQEKVAIGFQESQLSHLEVKEDISIRKADQSLAIDMFTDNGGGNIFLRRATSDSNFKTVSLKSSNTQGGEVRLFNIEGKEQAKLTSSDVGGRLELSNPLENIGFSILTEQFSTNVDIQKPQTGNGILHIVDNDGGSSYYYGSNNNTALITFGHQIGNASRGSIKLGNSSTDKLLQLTTSSGDAAGKTSGKIEGFNSEGNKMFFLGAVGDAQTKGSFSIYDQDAAAAVYMTGQYGGQIVLQSGNNANQRNVTIGTVTGNDQKGKVSVHNTSGSDKAGM